MKKKNKKENKEDLKRKKLKELRESVKRVKKARELRKALMYGKTLTSPNKYEQYKPPNNFFEAIDNYIQQTKKERDKIPKKELEIMKKFKDFPTMIWMKNLEVRKKAWEKLDLEEQIKHAEKIIRDKLKINKLKNKQDLISSQIKIIRDSIGFKKELLNTLIRANKPEKDIEEIEKDIEMLLLKVDDIVERQEHASYKFEKRMEIYDYLIRRIKISLARRKYEQNKKKKKEDKKGSE